MTNYQEEYPEVSGCIENQWDEKVVNIEYLVKSVVEWIKDRIEHYEINIDNLANIHHADNYSPINAILLALEPDCINGTSYSGQWLELNKKQLEKLNKELVEAYKNDIANK